MHQATNPVQRAVAHASVHATVVVGVDRDGFDRCKMGSTWGFDASCTLPIGLERGDSAP